MSTRGLITLSVSLALGALLLLMGGLLTWRMLNDQRVTTYGGDFTLLHMSGEARRLSSLPGETKLLYFGYTSCPDVCPLALGNMVLALQLLSETQRARIQPVFVTVDPERDTPEAVTGYLSLYATDWLSWEGFSGDPDSTFAVVRQQYGLYYEKTVDPLYTEYLVNHPSVFLLVDSRGRLLRDGLIHDRAELGGHRALARDLVAALEAN